MPSSLPRRAKLGAQDAFDSVTRRREPFVPPRHLQGDVPGGFAAAGGAMLNLLIGLGKLGPDERVLELRCGHGMLARPLTEYLGPGASYDGIDPDPRAIAWCQHAYEHRLDFEFHHVPADAERFPFDDEAFDLIVAAGVLPRLDAAEVEQVLRESRRLLGPEGRLFTTGFLLDDDARGAIADGRAAETFSGSDGTRAPGPGGDHAYEEEWLLDRIAQCGFRTAGIRHGTWTPRPTGRAHQDVVVARA